MKKHIDPRMHSAEHILNGTMVKLFGCKRSFNTHIEKKKSKCDFDLDRPIMETEIRIIENKVNDIIKDNLFVTHELISKKEADLNYNMEKVPENIEGEIRIIKIGEYDACPCSGEHVKCTSEIGKFKIISFNQDKGVLRIRFKLE